MRVPRLNLGFYALLVCLLPAFTQVQVAGLNIVRSTPQVKESVPHPRGWTKRARAPPDAILDLRIALPQHRFAELEAQLYAVSDPAHERYGQHLSKADVEELVAPHPDALDAVNAWLEEHGIDGEADGLVRSPAMDWVKIRVPVALAEEMLDTEYNVWVHEESGDEYIRTLTYSVPAHVFDHVELIQPTTLFARMKNQKSTIHRVDIDHISGQANPVAQASSSSAQGSITLPNGVTVDASCNATVTITCLKQLYNAVGFTPSATNGNQIGITGYLEQFANINDLQLFFADQLPSALNSSFKFVSVNGGINSQNASEAGGEANLDTQFAFGLTNPTPATFWSTAGEPPFIPDVGETTNTNEPYTEWLDFVLAQEKVPQSISTSYGDDEQTVPFPFAQRVCNDFAQLGARGVSLMFSSGDGGVGDGDPNPATQQCFTNDGRNLTRFIPGFPASCPFVTAVGGTIHVPETAVFFSGGGFSNYFARPSYQDKVVPAFLNSLPKGTFEGLFNPNGRAFPDVSAQSDNFRVFVGGTPFLIGGTSASSPTFAGFVGLLNSVRLSHGLPSLGFLNPFIYSRGFEGLNDITVGNNPGCGTEGFNATVGWDPVTGFGTPDFAKLSKLVLEYNSEETSEHASNSSKVTSSSSASTSINATASSSTLGTSLQVGTTTTESIKDHGPIAISSTMNLPQDNLPYEPE